MNIVNRQVNENVNKPSSEVLRLECYKQVEDYVICNKYDRKNEEVTDEEMDKVIAKAEKLYRFITKTETHRERLFDESIPEGLREAYLRWLDYKRVACRKPIEIIKKKLIVPEGFVFDVKDVKIERSENKASMSIVLVANCVNEEGENVNKSIGFADSYEQLDLDFYDCTGSEVSMLKEFKEKSPINYSDGRKCFVYTYEVI